MIVNLKLAIIAILLSACSGQQESDSATKSADTKPAQSEESKATPEDELEIEIEEGDILGDGVVPETGAKGQNKGTVTFQAYPNEINNIARFISARGRICSVTFETESGTVCAYHNTSGCQSACSGSGASYTYSCWLNNPKGKTGITLNRRTGDVTFTY